MSQISTYSLIEIYTDKIHTCTCMHIDGNDWSRARKLESIPIHSSLQIFNKPFNRRVECPLFSFTNRRLTHISSDRETMRTTGEVQTSISFGFHFSASEYLISNLLLLRRIRLVKFAWVDEKRDTSLFEPLEIFRGIQWGRMRDCDDFDLFIEGDIKDVASAEAISYSTKLLDALFL